MTLNKRDIGAVADNRGKGRPDESVFTRDFKPANLDGSLAGRPLFVVCSGPSATQVDLDRLGARGIVSMAVNNAWTMFRPNYWVGVDDAGRFHQSGWYDPGIVKFLPSPQHQQAIRTDEFDGKPTRSNVKVSDLPNTYFFVRDELFDPRRYADAHSAGIMWGQAANTRCAIGIKGFRSVMLAAIGIAVYLGAGEVYLVGTDFSMDPEQPYAFGEKNANARHNNKLYDALNRRFYAASPHLERAGVRVYNTVAGSGLTAFDFLPFAEAVRRASAKCSGEINAADWYTTGNSKKKKKAKVPA